MGKKKTGKAEQILQEIGRAIDELIAKAKGSSGKRKEDINQRIEELKRNKKTLERDFEKFRKDHAEDIDNFEKSLQKAADEVKEALNRAFKTPKGNNKTN